MTETKQKRNSRFKNLAKNFKEEKIIVNIFQENADSSLIFSVKPMSFMIFVVIAAYCNSNQNHTSLSLIPLVITCPSLNPPSSARLIDSHSTRYGSVVTFECNKGYFMIGENNLLCLDENDDGVGEWNKMMPTCRRRYRFYSAIFYSPITLVHYRSFVFFFLCFGNLDFNLKKSSWKQNN